MGQLLWNWVLWFLFNSRIVLAEQTILIVLYKVFNRYRLTETDHRENNILRFGDISDSIFTLRRSSV